jgi:RNA-directed DNA polymerase
MNERGKSDSPVVPAKPPNKTSVAEVVEERGLAKGNTTSATHPGRRAGAGVRNGLDRVREVARRDKEARFTALLHHVDLARLRAAYRAIRPTAAPGVDGVTWEAYGRDLEANLRDLHGRLHAGRYRARPSRRAYIPKADGRQRPLGIAALEDKIAQRAVVEVLNAIYEVDFRGFSYGFRPGRSPHHALDALAVGIERKNVNWVLDADIREFFTSLDHHWPGFFIGVAGAGPELQPCDFDHDLSSVGKVVVRLSRRCAGFHAPVGVPFMIVGMWWGVRAVRAVS